MNYVTTNALFDELTKIGEEKKEKKEVHPALRMAGIVGKGLLGFATGKVVSEALLNKVDLPPQHKDFARMAAPVLGAGLALAYDRWKEEEQKELRRAYEDLHKQRERRPGQ